MLATSLDPFTTTFQPAQKLYRLFLTVLCCFRALSTSRQLCPRALSPSSSQRSTTCTLTFSAPRKSHVGIACTHDTSTDKKHHHDLFKDSLHDTGNHLVNHFFLIFARRVIFGMLIALPITLVYYILLGL
jgi:hypothetical protein